MRLMLVGLVMLAMPAWAQDDATITVRGEASVSAAPDLAVVRLGVTTEAGTASEALARNSDAMATVLETLAEEGIAERDLQTSAFNLAPRYAEGPGGRSDVAGYVARNTVTARVRALDALGEVLDAAAEAGANTFEGLDFSVADPTDLRDEALRQAVAEARRRAEVLAAEAGVTIGGVVRLDAAAGGPRPVEMAEMRMAEDSVPVAQGEVAISAEVTAVYAIAD